MNGNNMNNGVYGGVPNNNMNMTPTPQPMSPMPNQTQMPNVAMPQNQTVAPVNVGQPVPNVAVGQNIPSAPQVPMPNNVQQQVVPNPVPVQPIVNTPSQPVAAPVNNTMQTVSQPAPQPVQAPTNVTPNPQQVQPTQAPVPQITPNANVPVQPVNEIITGGIPSQDNVQSSVVENDPGAVEPTEGDGEDITFNYNDLYGIESKPIEDIKTDENDKPVFTTQDIVIENRSLEGRANDNVTPEFNLNALDDSIKTSDAKLTDNILNDKQQDRADTRRKILFIGILTLLLVVFIVLIFPILAGYK